MIEYTGTATLSNYLLRVFEVNPHGAAETPAALPDRHIEATSVDEARTKAAGMFEAERRQLRSLSCHADGGLVAYVLPPSPEPAEQPERARRRRRGR